MRVLKTINKNSVMNGGSNGSFIAYSMKEAQIVLMPFSIPHLTNATNTF